MKAIVDLHDDVERKDKFKWFFQIIMKNSGLHKLDRRISIAERRRPKPVY